MTGIPYDPDLPFAVISSDGKCISRFAYKADAKTYREHCGASSWSVIDTTPKPLIPVDAQYLTWRIGEKTVFAARTGEESWRAIALFPLAKPFIYTTASLEGYFKMNGITPVVLDAREEES